MDNLFVEKTPTVILFNGKNEHRIEKIESFSESIGEVDGKPFCSFNFSVKNKEFILEELNEFKKFPLVVEWVVKSERDKHDYALRETYHNWGLSSSVSKIANRNSENHYTITFDYKTRG